MANIVKTGELYPVALSEGMPRGYPRRTTRVRATAEFRPPRKDEWFLSGSIVEGYRAYNDMTTPYRIGELVRGEVVYG